MPKAVRQKTQAQIRNAQRAALKKLRDLDLISDRLDLRKKPSRYALRQIKKYDDVLTGKAVALKPADPNSFKGLYAVKGDTVIVPRRKGEKIGVNKQGEIVGKRKVGNRMVSTKYKRANVADAIHVVDKKKQYAIPLAQRGGKVHWQRWHSYDELKRFMSQYKGYRDWRNYVVEESVSRPLSNERLNEIARQRGFDVQQHNDRISKRKRKARKPRGV